MTHRRFANHACTLPRWAPVALVAMAAALCLPAIGARAAITLDAASSVQGNSSIHMWPHTVGLGNDACLVVGVSIFTANKSVTSVTYAGQPLTPVGARNGGSGANARRMEIWYLVSPPVGTADVVVTMSNGAKLVAGAASFFGVDPLDPLGTFVSAEGDDAAPTVTLASGAGEMVIDCVAVKGNADPVTTGAGQTRLWNDVTRTNGGNIIGAGSTEPGAASTTMSWTLGASEYWVIGAVAMKPAPPPPYQPDLSVKRALEGVAAYAINDYYEDPALFQVKVDSVLNGGAAQFHVRIENDGSNADAINVSGNGPAGGFVVQYLDAGGVDRTAAVTTGGYTLPPMVIGQSTVWTVTVIPAVSVVPGASFDVFVTATSSGDPLRTDQNQVTVTSIAPALALSKSADRGDVTPGEDIVYTVTAASTGLSDATGITVVDSIPGDTGYRIGSASFDPRTSALVSNVQYSNDGGLTWGYVPVDGGCGAPSGYDFCVTHIRWSLSGIMPPAQTFALAFAVRVR